MQRSLEDKQVLANLPKFPVGNAFCTLFIVRTRVLIGWFVNIPSRTLVRYLLRNPSVSTMSIISVTYGWCLLCWYCVEISLNLIHTSLSVAFESSLSLL